ncbi:MAG: phosphoribosylamine--glycine ligase [Pseudomonadota bacterium]|nr:phosphoribosylamine--glycine ligase [Pseudomonadota bacterium]
MRVLVIGNGGREHALCWAIAGSPLVSRLWCAPGNAGIAEEAECVALASDDIPGLVSFVRDNAVEFVVIGPEATLVAGLGDNLKEIGVKYFGPNQAAAKLEGSKGFMKDFCARHNIPTAAYGRFKDAASARNFAKSLGAPIVVKADGLAAGKGVVIADTIKEANSAIGEMLEQGLFGEAGSEIIIEEFLPGEEASFFALCDGKTALPLASAQDHKRVGEGDTGLNTGGMGAYSPAPIVSEKVTNEIMREIIEPTIRGMAAEGAPFKGILYAGLMIHKGDAKLLEYNVRFGDPECQALMMRLKSDILPALIASHDGVLNGFDLRWYEEAAMIVVMAAKGYPRSYTGGSIIKMPDPDSHCDNVKIFHAGTLRNENGDLVANGGRVLGVAAMGDDIATSHQNAYQALNSIEWPEGFFRRDIGWRVIKN